MRGVFHLVAPEETQIAMTITATLKEWKEIRGAFEALDHPPGAAGVLSKQIWDLIRVTEATLAQNSWTTGYASGVETE